MSDVPPVGKVRSWGEFFKDIFIALWMPIVSAVLTSGVMVAFYMISIGGYLEKISAIEKSTATLNDSLEKLGTKVGNVEVAIGKSSAMEPTLDKVEHAVANVAPIVAKLETRASELDKVSGKVDALVADVAKLQANVEGIVQDKSTKESIEKLNETVATIANLQNAIATKVDSLNGGTPVNAQVVTLRVKLEEKMRDKPRSTTQGVVNVFKLAIPSEYYVTGAGEVTLEKMSFDSYIVNVKVTSEQSVQLEITTIKELSTDLPVANINLRVRTK